MAAPKQAPKANRIEKRPTNFRHIFLIDWNDDGILREIAVVAETPDGTIFGMDVGSMHKIDKARLKKFVTSQHADKYPLWELLSQGVLNNGLNALDFFHQNYVKVKRPRGAVVGGGLASVEAYGALDKQIGAEFTNGDNGTIAGKVPTL